MLGEVRKMHEHSAHNHSSHKNIGVAFILNAAFVIIEIVGGLLTNSVAILSDAIHDLGDSFTLGLSWFLEKKSSRSGNSTFTYGYKRLSLIGALMNSIILIVGSVLIVVRALPRLINPEPIEAGGMVLLALLGIIINGAAVLRLKKGSKISERVVSLHLLEDVLGWVAVLIVSIVLLFADIPILDPILSLLITVFVLRNVYKNFKQILRIFLQAVPEGFDISEIENKILATHPEIMSIHKTNLWTLDGETNIMTFHMCTKSNPDLFETVELKRAIKETLANMGIQDVTMELETTESCSNIQGLENHVGHNH